jgi:hypothetical protein
MTADKQLLGPCYGFATTCECANSLCARAALDAESSGPRLRCHAAPKSYSRSSGLRVLKLVD